MMQRIIGIVVVIILVALLLFKACSNQDKVGIGFDQAVAIALRHAESVGDDLVGYPIWEIDDGQEHPVHWQLVFDLKPSQRIVWVNRDTGEVTKYVLSR